MMPTGINRDLRLQIHSIAHVMASAILATTLVACGSDRTGPGAGDVSHLMGQLSVNASALTLSTIAPYNTFQIQVTPKTLTGDLLSEQPTLKFVVGDGQDTTVFVSATGLITAHAPTQGVQVRVLATIGKVTKTDSVLIQVTGTPPVSPTHPLQTFSIHAPGNTGYSINCSLSSYSAPITPTVVDANGNPIANPVIAYRSPDTSLMRVDLFTGTVTPKCFGVNIPITGWVVATATVYGVQYVDSVRVTLDLPVSVGILILATGSKESPDIAFLPTDIVVAQGGIVTFSWFCISDAACNDKLVADIVFDHPEMAAGIPDSILDPGGSGTVYPPSDGSGNIAPWFGDAQTPDYLKNFRLRRFPTAGVTHFHSSLHPNATGTITVLPTQQP